MKLYRLLAIIMLLLNRGQMTARELADYFEVSIRTIYRDVETINQAGIPIRSLQGSNGGYEIMEQYKLNQNLLTPAEIKSVIVALEGVTTTLDDQQMNAVMEKMKNIVDQEKDLRTSDPLVLDLRPWGENPTEKERVGLIRKAIEENTVMEFGYTNAQGIANIRQIEPLSVILRSYSWYCYGYCLLRDDYRLFKVSRMQNLVLTNFSFQPREKSYVEFSQENCWNRSNQYIHMVLHFQPQVRVRVEDHFDQQEIEYQNDGSMIVRVGYPEDEWVYSFVLSFGQNVKVLEPAYLRDIIKERAQKIIELYS